MLETKERGFWKSLLGKKHVTFEIEKEISNYVKEMFFIENNIIIWKDFLLSKRSGHFKELQKFCWKEVIYIRKLLLKKKGFLLNRDCYFKGYLLRKEILTFQSVKNY